ncbi:MAG: TerB family tellurite resistance protein [Labilithrix sp.]|nr:TerB family tellurite resistance protein [Labilithrix sp.]
MSIAENEALASLRILVAVARADGTVHNDERKSLAAALESLELPGGASVEALLAEDVDVDAELRVLTSADAREQIYRSAYFMAYADGTCTKEEQALLDRIAAATDPSPAQRESLDRMFVGRAKGGEPPLRVARIDDPARRAEEVKRRVLRHAVLAAALGAFPVPGLAIATDLAVIAVQLKMIRDVGGLWGHVVDRQAAKSILYGVGLGTGARLAVNNLAKLLPGWGSVIGATTSFASTYGLGAVIERLFAGGREEPADAEALRAEFKKAEADAKAVYADQKDVILQSQRENKATLDSLTKDLEAGAISQEEFDARVAELA